MKANAILVLARPSERVGFEAVARCFGQEYVVVSDVKYVGDVWFMKLFYAALRDHTANPHEVDDAVLEDVRVRCRYLRTLDPARARSLAAAAHLACERLLSIHVPSMILGGMADYYINDVLYRLATRKGVPLVTLTASFMPRHSLVTVWGEHHSVREIDADEVEEVMRHLRQRFHRANYGQPTGRSFGAHLGRFVRFHVTAAARGIQAFLYGDPLNFHFQNWRFRADARTLRDFFTAKYWANGWESALDYRRATVLIPLPFIPEATTDYWSLDPASVHYEDALVGMLRRLSGAFNIVIKEHVHMAGMRPRRFYDRLLQSGEVVLVTPAAFLTQVLDKADLVIVGGGTVGLEAAVRGKPVITYCDSFWSSGDWATAALLGDVTPDLVDRCLATAGEHERAEGWEDSVRRGIRHAIGSTVRGAPVLAPQGDIPREAAAVVRDVSCAMTSGRGAFVSTPTPLDRRRAFVVRTASTK